MLVFFVLGLRGVLRFMAHWGSGGGCDSDSDSCDIIADALLMKRRRHLSGVRLLCI